MSMVLTILEGKDAGREFVFACLPILVGRTQACDVALFHPRVSRQHCCFYREEQRIFIEDLRSANGTLVNGVPVFSRAMLHPGDILGIGPFKFRFDTFETFERTEPAFVECRPPEAQATAAPQGFSLMKEPLSPARLEALASSATDTLPLPSPSTSSLPLLRKETTLERLAVRKLFS